MCYFVWKDDVLWKAAIRVKSGRRSMLIQRKSGSSLSSSVQKIIASRPILDRRYKASEVMPVQPGSEKNQDHIKHLVARAGEKTVLTQTAMELEYGISVIR